jgi:hypothetical protein
VEGRLEAFCHLLESGNLQAAVDALHGVVMGAGESVGMRVVTGGRGPCRARFDAESRAAGTTVTALPRALEQHYQQLRALL